MKLKAAFIGLFSLLVLFPGVLGYTFDGQSPVSDSVRLVLNSTASQGDILALDVMAYEVPSVESAAFDIDFNSSVVEWEGRQLNDPDGFIRGNFLGESAWVAVGNPKYLNGTINKSKVIVSVLGDSPVGGSGWIITVRFRIVGTGSTPLTFSRCNLIKSDTNFTDTSWLGGMLQTSDIPPYQEPQDDPPAVNLDYPYNNNVITEDHVEIMCSASDDFGLRNITLYTNMTGSWEAAGTSDTPDTEWVQSFLLQSLPEGTCRWNCLAYDDSSQPAWAPQGSYFSVSLPADHTPPAISGGQATGNLSTGSNINLSLTTNEPAACRYSLNPGMPLYMMKDNFTLTGSLFHSVNVSVPSGRVYNYYIKCEDAQGNSNDEDYIISFTVGTPPTDNEAPTIIGLSSNVNLNYGTTTTLIKINTDETAECRISKTSGEQFSSMEPFSQTYTTNHTHTISDLAEGRNHTYYIKCRDGRNNTNPDTVINFFVCYDVDSDCSRAVEMEELMSFIDRWYYDNRDVRMRRVMQGIGLWRAGSA